MPAVLAGGDVVIAAETGSGKTHGYLIPVIQRLCSMQSSPQSDSDNSKPKKQRLLSLVLCPNVMLCEQVVRMANSLCDNTGQPILRTTCLGGHQVWNLTVFIYSPMSMHRKSFKLLMLVVDRNVECRDSQ